MGKLTVIFFFVVSLLIASVSGFTQHIIYSKSTYIISLNAIYSSNLISLNSNGYDDLYLITSDREYKIDSVFSSLSKKNYASFTSILDTIKSGFKIYSIVRDTSIKGKTSEKIALHILDYNNYKTAYLISLNDSVRKYGPVVAYIIQIYTLKSKIGYAALKSDCDVFPYECKAVIKRID